MISLRRLVQAGWLLREIRTLRRETTALRAGVDRIAEALELRNAHDYPQVLPQVEGLPGPIQVTYADAAEQQEWMDIELRLTAASGAPPTEEEIFEEWQRRHQPPADEDQPGGRA